MSLWSEWFNGNDSGTHTPSVGYKPPAPVDANGNPLQVNMQNYGQQLQDSLAQQQGLYGSEQGLLDQVTAESRGGGPNLAQQQLEMATNNNIASQAGAVASTRGLNRSQQARLIAGQGSALQQEAVGQSAEARMQLELAAQQQAAGLQGQMGSQNLSQYGTQVSANQAQNATALTAQEFQQQLAEQVAQQNAALKSSAQAQNAGLAGYGYGAETGAVSGAAALAGMGGLGGAAGGAATGAAAGVGGSAGTGALAAGEAGDFGGAALLALSGGGKVPGRARVPGNSRANDTQPAMLSPGELVIPREIANDPVACAAFASRMNKHKQSMKGAARGN